MNILVINGSPKGENSITLQTVYFLQKKFPEITFEVLHASQRIKALEKDFTPALEAIAGADVLLFSYPVYTFLAPCQLHRFVELMKEKHAAVAGKYATQLTTSKHFYDVTAHRYIMENCQDMGMQFVRGLSADMEDLLSAKGQEEAVKFFRYFLWSVKQQISEPLPDKPAYAPLAAATVPQREGAVQKSYEAESAVQRDAEAEGVIQNGSEVENTERKQLQKEPGEIGEVVIVTDCEQDNEALQTMIARFQAVLPMPSRVVNIREYPFRGGCLGCFRCAATGKCIYTDGFDEFLRSRIQTAAAIVIAFSVKDHSMGAVFKQYDDRQFCNGHRAVTMGMPMGYLVNGHYHQEENLRMVVEARAEVGGNFLAGVATNEREPDQEIDQMAARLMYALQQKYTQPRNFFGVGGMKIFRDLIYLMQGLMKADHKFYKEHNQYDFPQKKKGTLIGMYLVGALMSNPKIQKKAGAMMNEGMLAPYKKVLEKGKEETGASQDHRQRK